MEKMRHENVGVFFVILYGTIKNYFYKGRLSLLQCQIFRIFANSPNKRHYESNFNAEMVFTSEHKRFILLS
jgi:hypothetical protein